jgi:hypothetical protein
MNQPYIPQNAIVNVGTTVAWFSGDVAHRHSITLVDNKTKSTAYDSGSFNYFNASKPFTFNNVGIFAYSGPSNDKMWPNYKMNGTVTVVNQPLATSFNSSSSGGGSAAAASATGAGAAGNNNNNFDTIATLMVPSKLLGTTLANLKSQGFTIDNQYPFRSLRGSGSQAGGDPQQVLLVLASSGKNLNQVTSALSHVSATLPYK